MVATMLRRADKKAANSNLAKLGGTDEETPTKPNRHCPRAGSDQREPSSPRFEPRPLFLSCRGSKRGKPTAVRSSRHDALLARQKRGGAVARPRNHQKRQGKKLHIEANDFRCLRRTSIQATGKVFQKQKDRLNGSPSPGRAPIITTSFPWKHCTAGSSPRFYCRKRSSLSRRDQRQDRVDSGATVRDFPDLVEKVGIGALSGRKWMQLSSRTKCLCGDAL
jgi:hypothetical protein